MKYILLIFLFPIFCLGQVNDSNKLPELMPTSPKSFEFLKFTETPVSKYTGVPDISIPIYNIESKGLTIPIKLNYHSNGFKVDEEAGCTGLGWTLNANWSIVQQVEGFDDFGSLTRNRLMPNFANIIDVECNGSCPAPGNSVVSNCDIFLLGLSGAPSGSSTGDVGTAYLFGDNNYVNSLVLGTKDFQPDIFVFNVPGYSGKFILDWKNNQFVCLTDNKVKITPFNYNGFDAPANFAILVPDGHVFTFTIKEETIIEQNTTQQELWPQGTSSLAPDMAGTATSRVYQLTQIVTNKAEAIYLDYTTTSPIKNFPSVSQSKVYYETTNGSPFPNEMSDNFTSYSYTKQPYSYLDKITFNDGILLFNYSSRIDLAGSKKLDNIELRKTLLGNVIKKFDFNYDYFVGHTMGTNSDSNLNTPILINKTSQELTHRLKLLSVKEMGANPYLFEYDTEQLPKKTSFAKDYWGNYNGVLTNNSNFIDIYKFNIGREYFQYYNYKDNINCSIFQYAKAAVLNKITYPTGGFSTFDYELNSFSNIQVPTINQGTPKSFRLSTVQNSSLNLDQVVLIEGGNTIFKVSGMLSTVGCYPANPEAYSSCFFKIFHFKKELISFIKSNTTYNAHLNSYGLKYVLAVDLDFIDGSPSNPDLFNYYNDNQGARIGKTINVNTDEFHSNLTYNLSEGIAVFVVSGGCGNDGSSTTNSSQATFNVSYNDYKPLLGTESVGAGIRVKNVTNYSAYYQIASKKNYSYQGGVLMGGLNYFNKVYIPNYGWISGSFNQSIGNKLILNSRNFTAPSGNSQGRFVGYDIVDESSVNFENPALSEQNGRIREIFVNNPEIGSVAQGFYGELHMPIVQNEKDNGLMSKQQIYDKNNVLVKEILKGYGFVKLNCFSGMKSILREKKTYTTSGNMYGVYANYTIGVYPIRGSFSPLAVSTEIDYYGSQSITTRTDYTYNNYNQIINSKTYNSKNELVEISNLYPKDFASTSLNGMALLMAEKNLLTPIISKQTKKNNILISNEEFEYSFKNGSNNPAIPNIFTLSKYKSAKGGNSLETKISYNLYDAYLNVTEVSKESDYYSYIWGYNGAYPIAKIENSKYNSITPSLITAAQNTSNTGSEGQLIIALDNLRSSLPGALITTYTYLPLIGVSTITDSKGNRTTYTYDSSNRLQYIKDQDLNVLQKYCYNYLGQGTDCGTSSTIPTTYKNVFKSSSFTKQSCGAGLAGSTHIYSVPAGIYSSTVSQADANAQADNEIAVNGQNFANVNGNCIVILAAPTGLTFNSATSTSLNFSWNAVEGATGYKIYKDGTYFSSVTSPTISASVSGLTVSTNYGIQIRATNASIDSALSTSVLMSTLPSVPTGLNLTSAATTSVNFSWNAVLGATGYKIYKNGSYVSSVTAPVTTGSLSGLTSSTAYSVQILASNVSGDGDLCASVSMSTLPLAPSGLILNNATASSINFSWNTVISATVYKIYKNGFYVSSVAAPASTGSISGLTVSTSYDIQILAANVSGDGALSSSVSMSTLPAVPASLIFNSATATSLNFSWTAVPGATGYKIYKDGIYVSSVSTPAGYLSGLTGSTAYGVQVSAINSSGDGALSTIVSMTTVPETTTPIFNSATVSSLNFSWAAVYGALGYKIYKDGVYISSVTTTTGSLSGLTIGTLYNIQVLAYNVSGDGLLSSSVAMPTIAAAPTGLLKTSASASTLNFTWSAVTGATSYRIYKNGSYVSSVTSVTAPFTSGSISGLTSATTYGIQVKSTNSSGDSAFSNVVSMETVPLVPTGLVLTSATPTSLNFSWAAVTGATGYKIYKNNSYVSSVTAPSTTGSLSGLNTFTSYDIQVLASTDSSNSALSEVVSMRTLLPAPVGLSFTSSGISTLNFSWNFVSGAMAYKIYKNGVYVSTAYGTTGSLSGLSPLTTYNVQVLAYNPDGDGALTSVVPMTTSPAVLGFYKNSGAYPTTGGVGLNGSIYNNSIHSLYIYVVVQSASASSGTGSGYVTITGTTIGAGGTFVQYGQNFISNNYVIMSPGMVNATGSYGGATGSQMILAYSMYPGGPLTYWSTSN